MVGQIHPEGGILGHRGGYGSYDPTKYELATKHELDNICTLPHVLNELS